MTDPRTPEIIAWPDTLPLTERLVTLMRWRSPSRRCNAGSAPTRAKSGRMRFTPEGSPKRRQRFTSMITARNNPRRITRTHNQSDEGGKRLSEWR